MLSSKHAIIIIALLGLMLGSPMISAAQVSKSDEARAYFFQAETAYEDGEFDRALEYLDEAERILGRPAPIFLALEAKAHWAQEDIEATRAAIDQFYADPKASDQLKSELSGILIALKEKEKAAQAEARRLAQIELEKQQKAEQERRRQDMLQLERLDKQKVIQNATTEEFDRLLVTTGRIGRDGAHGRGTRPGSGSRDGEDGDYGKDGSNGDNGGFIHIVIREVKSYSVAAPIGAIEQRGPNGELIPFSGIHPLSKRPYVKAVPPYQPSDIKSTTDPYGRNVPYVPNVSFDAVQHDFGRPLTIDASGATGGQGGTGRDGTPGRGGRRDGNKVNGGRGGWGGNGGRGGRGGDSGDVIIEIYGSADFQKRVIASLQASAKGGAGGKGGKGGKGAKGGYGVSYENFIGTRYNGREGQHGRNGDTGRSGQPGKDGKVDIRTYSLDEYRTPTSIIELFKPNGAELEQAAIDKAKRWAAEQGVGDISYKDAIVYLSDFEKPCELGQPRSCYAMGRILRENGRSAEAVQPLKTACASNTLSSCTELGAAYYSLEEHALSAEVSLKDCNRKIYAGCHIAGIAFRKLNQLDQAKEAFLAGCNGKNPASCYFLGDLSEAAGDIETAVHYFDMDCAGGYEFSCVRLGQAYERLEQFANALAEYQEHCTPKTNLPCIGIGNVYVKLGEIEKAVEAYRLACGYGHATACSSEAWTISTNPNLARRDGERAVEAALRAMELHRDPPAYMRDTLAAAYAENGEFEQAIQEQISANEAGRLAGDSWVAKGEARLELYKQGKPYREQP